MTKLSTTILLIFLALPPASALDCRPDSLSPHRMCESLRWNVDKADCHATARSYQYLDERAVNVCASFFGDIFKIRCLHSIGDKFYDEAEICTCAEQEWDLDKDRCLERSGRAR